METGKLHNEEVTCAGCAIMKILKATFLDIFQETVS